MPQWRSLRLCGGYEFQLRHILHLTLCYGVQSVSALITDVEVSTVLTLELRPSKRSDLVESRGEI